MIPSLLKLTASAVSIDEETNDENSLGISYTVPFLKVLPSICVNFVKQSGV